MHVSADPHLQIGSLPPGARGLVLMLHGGAERGRDPIDERSLAYRRTRWMMRSVAGRLEAGGAGVALLRFTVKGWNAGAGAVPSPVADARQALATIRDRYAGVPVVLLGHSMGARTAARVADDPAVVGVVGLAPWLPADDPVAALAGKHLVAAHGRRDRITSARATERFVRRAREVAASARFVDMGGLGHYMLTGRRHWNAVAVTESLQLLDTVAGITSPE